MMDSTTVKAAQNTRPGRSFALITLLFFLWGFVTALNDILTPCLKRYFDLSYLQAGLVQMMFFGAYFVGSLFYYLMARRSIDLIGKIGYRKALSLGLLVACFGTLLFTPAAFFRSFGLFLTALFILGLGFTLLQIAANPYVVLLGPAQSAATRLSLAQGLNSLGTTLAPVLGAAMIFGHLLKPGAAPEIRTIEVLYLIFAGVILIMALFIRIAPLPDIIHEERGFARENVFRLPQLLMGVIAIFTYVGAEVSTGTFLISFMRLPGIGALSELEGSRYVSLYWGGLMIGRFMGAICFSASPEPLKKTLIMVCLPSVSILGLWWFAGSTAAICGGLFLVLNTMAFFAGRFLPARTLALFAITNGVLLIWAVFASGHWAGWLLVGTGLFNSIMWSVIFSLALDGLGRYTNQASSLLVMAILGAALIPPLQGAIADHIGLQYSILLPACCYLYLTWYGIWSNAQKKKVLVIT